MPNWVHLDDPDWYVKVGGLLVALVLIAFDLVALKMARRERAERLAYIAATERLLEQSIADEEARARHLTAVEATARLYTRAEYEKIIASCVEHADQRINCYWYSLHRESEAATYATMNDRLQAAAGDRAVAVKIITLRDRARIAAAWELNSVGVEVRFTRTVAAFDLRFTLADDEHVVLGSPGLGDHSSRPSHEGVEIYGSKLAALLHSYFDEQWDKASTYDEYAAHTVRTYLDDKTNSRVLVATELGLPLAEIERLAALGPVLQ